MIKIQSSEITPEQVYLNRRQFMKGMGAAALGAAVLAACGPSAAKPATQAAPTATGSEPKAGAQTDELGDPLTSYEVITNYNNYYEFSYDKEGIGQLAADLPISPWTVAVGGLVKNPKTYGLEDLLKKFEQQERIYRLRCVEGWSMVIPWMGFALAQLLKEVEPTSDAKYVAFQTLSDPDHMQGQHNHSFVWPYTEGLRLDEAMNNLAILATGLYGKELPKQDGAPIRLVVPWKYGFKSVKAIVKIDLVADQPETLWSTAAPNEYGFYANVNPEVPHPRWAQDSERRLGEAGRRPTLKFNGYAEEVAHLYDGMDLHKYY
ncbi:MAG TPA: protein-methionine-sulfoxide reductase catalytic subunit MsrP [Anaerolineae bacterium]|nr:protein-methionine-sulfoxide reductase catalytic subunit MsrP [Anaerolineae bacterium]